MKQRKDKKYVNINLAFMNTNLTISEATVLSFIDGLSIKKGYCFASNDSICMALNLNDRTLYRILKNLEKKKYIKRVTKSLGNDGKERKIYVSPTAKNVSCM